jgi:hypothetical protein
MAKVVEEKRLEASDFMFRRAHDEWCVCGHRRSVHGDTLSWGHGDCDIETCDCMKFTWTDKSFDEEESA